MKSFLIVTVFVSCSWCGCSMGLNMKKRYQLLESMADMMEKMHVYMTERGTTLREALESLLMQEGVIQIAAEGLLYAWKENGRVQENWIKAVDGLCREHKVFGLLLPCERQWLYSLITEQAAAYGDRSKLQWICRWDDAAVSARMQYERKGALYGKLGVLVGLALAVLML